MNDAPRYVTVRDYLRVVREHRVLILLITLLFGAAAYAYADNQTPEYTAEASLSFESPNTQTSLFGATVDQGGETPEQRAAANAATLTRPAVIDRARRILGVKQSPEFLAGLVDAQPEARTQLVIVRARGSQAKAAAGLANAMARAAVEVTREEARKRYRDAAQAQRRVLRHLPTGTGSEFFRIQQLENAARLEELARIASPASVRRRATVPGSPTSPHVVRTAILGLLIGLTLGLVAAFVRDSLDRRFRSSSEIAEELQVPLLGSVDENALGAVPLEPRKGVRALGPHDMESFRIVRNNIEFLNVEDPPKVVLVTSAQAEEGKSTVSVGLAAAFARAGKLTLLVECDLRRPTLAKRLGIHSQPGLSDYLAGSTTPSEVVQPVELPTSSVNGGTPDRAGFAAIPAGTPAAQAVEVLRSKRCFDFFNQVRQVYDAIVVDTSPLLSVADTLELLPVADAVVVCVRGSRTIRDQLHAAKGTIDHFTDAPSAVVVTGLRSPEETPYYGYYGHEVRAR